MIENLCPKCAKGLTYNEKTGLYKCRNGKCGRTYTLSALRRRYVNRSRVVMRKGMTSNRSNEGNNQPSL